MKIKKFDTINVVPFIDIMLVLLVIVLTTATFIAKGLISVELPKASVNSSIKSQKEIVISITEQNQIYFDEKLVSLENLDIKLNTCTTDILFKINCDKNTKFENFIAVLDKLKIRNFTNLAIITKYE